MADRRTTLRLIAAAALLPGMGTRVLAASPAAPGFAPPDSAMRYSRLLERTLAGGYAIRVRRSFDVAFERQPGGYLLGGHQVGVEVEMPEALARLAQLEREREETALFPIMLDPAGRITGAPDYSPPAELERAIAVVRNGLASAAEGAEGRAALDAYLARLTEATSVMAATLPPDLFAPPETPQVDERKIELPGGLTGLLSVRFSAARDPRTGLMCDASREIVSAIGEDRRVTRESWTLERA